MKKILGYILVVSIFSILIFRTYANNNQDQTDGERKNRMKITILYDNYVFKEGTQAEWGFSCFIEVIEKTILFDTGTDPDILAHNVEQHKVDLKKIELIVLSHEHRDHTGGLQRIIKENKNVSVYVLKSFTRDFVSNIKNFGINVIEVKNVTKICSKVYSTGELGSDIKEQSLILDSDSGLVIITGCSHPGIVDILRKTKNIFKKDIYFVLGGFHLLKYSENQLKKIIGQFKDLGVKKVGPTHCTGKILLRCSNMLLGVILFRSAQV